MEIKRGVMFFGTDRDYAPVFSEGLIVGLVLTFCMRESLVLFQSWFFELIFL